MNETVQQKKRKKKTPRTRLIICHERI